MRSQLHAYNLHGYLINTVNVKKHVKSGLHV